MLLLWFKKGPPCVLKSILLTHNLCLILPHRTDGLLFKHLKISREDSPTHKSIQRWVCCWSSRVLVISWVCVWLPSLSPEHSPVRCQSPCPTFRSAHRKSVYCELLVSLLHISVQGSKTLNTAVQSPSFFLLHKYITLPGKSSPLCVCKSNP